MSSVVLSGDTSGTLTLSAPAVAGSSTQTLAAVTGTLAPIVSGTAVTASGTSIDFTGIPAWAKKITVMFSGVSTNGTSAVQIQIGSGSVTTSGYVGSSSGLGTSGIVGSSYTSGLVLYTASGDAAANTRHGNATFYNLSGNTWSANGMIHTNTGYGSATSTSITLAATLDRVRITTVNGTDTFDAGSINILYE